MVSRRNIIIAGALTATAAATAATVTPAAAAAYAGEASRQTPLRTPGEQVVAAFLAAFSGGPSGIIEGLKKYAHKDIIWKSAGFPTPVGLDACIQYIKDYETAMGFTRIDITLEEDEGIFERHGYVHTARRDVTTVPALLPRWPGDGKFATLPADVFGRYQLITTNGKIQVVEVDERWNPGEYTDYLEARAATD